MTPTKTASSSHREQEKDTTPSKVPGFEDDYEDHVHIVSDHEKEDEDNEQHFATGGTTLEGAKTNLKKKQ